MLSLYPSVQTVMMLIFSGQVSMASINCNHAMIDDEGMIVADVCFKDGADSMMLQCIDGEGYLKEWTLNDNCDEGSNVFATRLSDFGFEVVCDADPCHIAVFEVYDDGSDSGDSSEWDSSSHSSDYYVSAQTTTSTAPTTEPTPYPTTEPTTEPTDAAEAERRRLESDSAEHSHSHSDSSSGESSECDFSSTPDIAAFIIGACVPTPFDENESMTITCTGIHDATVSFWTNDDNHECDGNAYMTVAVSEFFGDVCATMVSCNVKAGEEHDAAPSVTLFAPLLIAFAVFLNA